MSKPIFRSIISVILIISFMTNTTSIQTNATSTKLALIAQKYNCKIYPILGDGNCQFRSIGHQLGLLGISFSDGTKVTKNKVKKLRSIAARHIVKYRQLYKPFIERKAGETEHQAFKRYINKLVHTNEWGDEFTLRALSREFNVNIIVVSDTGYIRANIRPKATQSIILGHIFEAHYVSLLSLVKGTEMEVRNVKSLIDQVDGVEYDNWVPAHI